VVVPMNEVTRILSAIEQGDSQAAEQEKVSQEKGR
jgi:hypothetical protein